MAEGSDGGAWLVELGVEVEEVGGRLAGRGSGMGRATKLGCQGCGGPGQGTGESGGGGGGHWRQRCPFKTRQKYNTGKYTIYNYVDLSNNVL